MVVSLRRRYTETLIALLVRWPRGKHLSLSQRSLIWQKVYQGVGCRARYFEVGHRRFLWRRWTKGGVWFTLRSAVGGRSVCLDILVAGCTSKWPCLFFVTGSGTTLRSAVGGTERVPRYTRSWLYVQVTLFFHCIGIFCLALQKVRVECCIVEGNF